MKGRIKIDREICKGCGLCVAVCPKKGIEISDRLNKKGYYPAEFIEDHRKDGGSVECTGCALCAVACPDVAIEVYREEKRKPDDRKAAESGDGSGEG